jgi:hypothetical protein
MKVDGEIMIVEGWDWKPFSYIAFCNAVNTLTISTHCSPNTYKPHDNPLHNSSLTITSHHFIYNYLIIFMCSLVCKFTYMFLSDVEVCQRVG